jgi:predicted Zn-dependent peptidase
MNGTTNADRTNYFETLPTSELQLALWLEADRMRWLNVSQENLDNQRAVVKEEYRMRYENAPYRLAQIELDKHIFAGYAPYDHPTIGNLDDLDRAQISWVRDFHARYYVASNAVLTIAGGFDADEAMRWVHEYFDDALTAAAPVFSPPPTPPAPSTETRLEAADKNAKTPALMFGWRIAPHQNEMHASLELLARILADGESSLLYESLVRDKAWARNVSAYTYDHSGPDAFIVSIELTEKAKLDVVEGYVRKTLNSLATSSTDAPRLDRALQRAKSSFLFDLQSNQSRANTFGEYEVIFGDARVVFTDLERLLSVTPEDIRHAASQFVSPTTQTIVRVTPVALPLAGAKGGAR